VFSIWWYKIFKSLEHGGKLGESRNILAIDVKRSTSRVREEITDSSTLCTPFQKSELSGKP